MDDNTRAKLIFDLFKYFATVSMTCALLMAGLIERCLVIGMPIRPELPWRIYWSFGAAAFFSVLAMAVVLFLPKTFFDVQGKENRSQNQVHGLFCGVLLVAPVACVFFFVNGLHSTYRLCCEKPDIAPVVWEVPKAE